MYGLTMSGPQMLFFSISHTLFPMVLAVFLSVPAGLAWLLQSGAALLLPSYRAKVGLASWALFLFAITLAIHTIALWGYESWSSNAMRVPVCLLGIALTCASLVAVLSNAGSARPPAQRLASEA